MFKVNGANEIVLKEGMSFMLGELLGVGSSRTVFAHPTSDKLVIKVEDSASTFQNVLEWEHWLDIKLTKNVKWVAPCVSISYSGTFLIQERTTDLKESQMPKLLPMWITDRHINNFGMLNGKVVCRDYSHINATLSSRMTKS